jgi:hypothetical protein
MKDLALCFLAYGEEHIQEFNKLCYNLIRFDNVPHIFVLTDDKSKVDNLPVTVLETHEEFNFNLKRHVIEEAFKLYDTIILLDTDIEIKSLQFMSTIDEDGMYVKWVDPKLTHKGIRLDTKNNDYLIELNKLNKHILPVQFIPEYCVVIKISDVQKRINFIKHWTNIHKLIKQFEPTDRHYNLNGAIEGCIMYLSCLNVNIPIISNEKLFESITHYASTHFEKRIV